MKLAIYSINTIILCVCFGCMYTNNDKQLESDMMSLLWSFSVKVSDLCENDSYSFPYSDKGSEYLLYKMAISDSSDNILFSKGRTLLFRYDHEEKKVYDSNVEYINKQNIVYTSDCNNVIIVLVLSIPLSTGIYLCYGNDLCLYEYFPDKNGGISIDSLLGNKIVDYNYKAFNKIHDASFFVNDEYDYDQNLKRPVVKTVEYRDSSS